MFEMQRHGIVQFQRASCHFEPELHNEKTYVNKFKEHTTRTQHAHTNMHTHIYTHIHTHAKYIHIHTSTHTHRLTVRGQPDAWGQRLSGKQRRYPGLVAERQERTFGMERGLVKKKCGGIVNDSKHTLIQINQKKQKKKKNKKKKNIRHQSEQCTWQPKEPGCCLQQSDGALRRLL